MSKKIRSLAAFSMAAAFSWSAPSAHAQIGTGPWTSYTPTYTVQERGCGDVAGLTFKLTCSNSTDEQRAELRYATYSSGTRQFQGYVKINSLGGTRVSLKQTFWQDSGAYFMLAVENGGRLYTVHDGQPTVGSAPVGSTVRVNTIHQVGSSHKLYINGSLKQTIGSSSGNFYDKIGTYRTSSGRGPISATWSSLRWWRK